MSITIEEACDEVIRRSSNEYTKDEVMRVLMRAGGAGLVASEHMWRYYGLKTVRDRMAREADHIGDSCAGLMSTLSVS